MSIEISNDNNSSPAVVCQDKLNEKLDRYASQMLDCYQEILVQRDILEGFMKDGYLNMSKARSIMGCANLSQLQIPGEELKADVRVVHHLDDFFDDVKSCQFELISSKSTTSIPKWIAPFPSQSLNRSQKAFSNSLNVALLIAEKQSLLAALQKEYRTLLDEKKTLQ